MPLLLITQLSMALHAPSLIWGRVERSDTTNCRDRAAQAVREAVQPRESLGVNHAYRELLAAKRSAAVSSPRAARLVNDDEAGVAPSNPSCIYSCVTVEITTW